MKTRAPLLFIFSLISSFSYAQVNLGEVVITSQRQDSSSVIGQKTMTQLQRLNVASALNLLPGITLGNIGPRNESVVYLRGFDLRQVPVFIDGIPVYVPYDGYVDLARFTTYDLSKITVSKGNASVLYGPNTMGGAINLVSKQPTRKLEVQGNLGWLSGGYDGALNIGSRWKKFYVQAGVSKFQRDYFKLPNDSKRENSYNSDAKVNVKLAYTPNANSEYAIGYVNQHGEKGTPVYAGKDTLNSQFKSPRFWKWPYWDKQSLYFLSNTKLDSSSYLKVRAFYDQFRNRLESYDDAKYTTQTKPYAFTSFYDDYSVGANAEYGRALSSANSIKAALHYKKDIHRENNAGEPVRKTSDNTYSAGLTDEHQFSEKWRATAGVSFNARESDGAEEYNSTTKVISQFPANKNNAVNVQASLSYQPTSSRFLEASFGRMTRFATIKDRYSYRLGTAIPNPDLKAEQATHYELKYNDVSIARLRIQAAVFYSRINDVIQMVNNVKFDTAASRWQSQMQNKGRAEFYGGEASFNYQITTGLNAGVNYSYITRKNLDNKALHFTDVPEHKLTGIIGYAIKRLELNVDGSYNSFRYSTSYGTKAPGFFLLNGGGSFIINKYLKFSAGVNNIFDKEYMLVEGYPEQGRNFFTKLLFNL
ncbi:TonB-dependent receptor [Chitinophaga sp. SYP-B3965]|uniref:TonB-dependent receptor plug domain-containing protein n=1 Tax=Chitinophaga sp. SYP-B3965 TaxID=2663120 RepID=UPI001299EE0B|nr:TonB-dependent receptor [Chitinophaga sp. SYP-B3965]MRG46621.1 TonB-dependent receptor [Chitinophaga sp. SYP-B3965]